MKGSTLHRSGLTREKMNVLATFAQSTKKGNNTRAQLNQYYKATKTQELDLLWGGVQRGIQKVHNATRTVQQKSPAVYLITGFITGALFMCAVFLIVSLCSMTPKTIKNEQKTNIAVIGDDVAPVSTSEVVSTQEKYVVKSGDTLNGIAYRFYGKYNEAKILEIQRINNIANPASLRVGQELLIPVTR